MKIPIVLFLSVAASHADELQLADTAKLSDPTQRDAEVSRLTIANDSSTLMGYHFLKAPQMDGKPPLHVLAAQRDYKSSYISKYDYPIDKPDELFAPGKPSVRARTEPSLDAISNSMLLVFDPHGKETRPFGGNNYINFGYLFDFNADGILDRAGSTNYGLKNAETQSVQVFELESVEPKPRTLLRVIFNFHPRSADASNDWTFECFDENSDGLPEIAFGPQVGHHREIVFRYDKGTDSYSAGKLPKNAHVRVLSADDKLESIAKAGGLGYPLLEKGNPPLLSVEAENPYVFQSLKGLPISDLAAFFQGKSRRNAFEGAENSFPNKLPENLAGMSPKEAAVAMAEANRTPQHRAGYQLAIDDRNGIAPPASGWIHYAWNSSGCYSASSGSYAIRFGVPDSVLIYYGDNQIGYVGRNRWADQPAHNAHIIHLSEKEARFVADTLFWLDRIRSRALPGTPDDHSSSSSTADGHASVSLFPDGAAPRLLASATAWATSSISGSWDEDYKPETFVNLADLLVQTAIPEMLADRWESTRDITRHSLVTSTDERLEPRVDDNERKRLAAILANILEINSHQPVPAAILSPLCIAAGDEALVSLLPPLENLLTTLPAPDGEEEDYKTLSRRFARDHFGKPVADDPNDHPKDYERMQALGQKLRNHPAHVLREPLESTITRLRLATDPERLKQAILKKTPETTWALTLLRRTDPAAWAVFVSAEFRKSPNKERVAIFTTLAAGHPPAAAEIIRNLSPGERDELRLEIVRFHQTHEPASLAADIPQLLKIVRNREADFSRRQEAIDFLGSIKFPAEYQQDFRSLLVAEIKDPVKGKETWMGNSRSTAVNALVSLPNPAQHLRLILETPGITKSTFWSGYKAVSIMSADDPERDRILADFLRSQFTESQGFMNRIFIEALVKNLRSLAAEIAAYASVSPRVQDGDGADYSGGHFKSPVGHRYHIAREITALWTEKDPTTLGKMWIAFVSAHPDSFDDEGSAPLRLLAQKHINTLSTADRENALAHISRLIPVPKYHAGTIDWLTSPGK